VAALRLDRIEAPWLIAGPIAGRTKLETVCAAIGEILCAYTPAECANYFRNSGYQT
jgi:hypothetical protein